MCGCWIDPLCLGCECGCRHGTPEGRRDQAEWFALQAQSNAERAEMWMGRAKEAGWMQSTPSLRDEMVAAHGYVMDGGGTVGVRERAMEAALAVARRHVRTLPYARYIGANWLRRDDVLRMLDGDDDE